jgi:hypothetical protein
MVAITRCHSPGKQFGKHTVSLQYICSLTLKEILSGKERKKKMTFCVEKAHFNAI